MKLLKAINNSLSVSAVRPLSNIIPFAGDARWIGNEVTYYSHRNGEEFIEKGYNFNAVVYTCLNLIMKMFGKVPFYLVELKKDERKHWALYRELSKKLHDPRALAEAGLIRKKTLDGIIEDNDVAKFLKRPNRNQSGTQYREMLIGHKKLTGEGNQWFIRDVDERGNHLAEGEPVAAYIVPKFMLQLVGDGQSIFDIIRYQVTINGDAKKVPKENLLMWNENSFEPPSSNLSHLRGQSPLQAALLDIQALNETAQREIKEALNGYANGLLYRTDLSKEPSVEQTIAMRNSVNKAVNGSDVADTIAMMAGQWGYIPFGKSAREMERVKLSEGHRDSICTVLGVPPGLMKTDQKYENASAFYRQLVYGAVAPEVFGLRDAYNTTLLDMFDVDRDRFAIDADLLSLPEIAEDMKDQMAAVMDASFLSDNEKRIYTGWEPKNNPILDLTQREYDELGVSGNLDEEEEALND